MTANGIAAKSFCTDTQFEYRPDTLHAHHAITVWASKIHRDIRLIASCTAISILLSWAENQAKWTSQINDYHKKCMDTQTDAIECQVLQLQAPFACIVVRHKSSRQGKAVIVETKKKRILFEGKDETVRTQGTVPYKNPTHILCPRLFVAG